MTSVAVIAPTWSFGGKMALFVMAALDAAIDENAV
jgi:hypothetical protein